MALQIGDFDVTGVEHAGGERGVHLSRAEYVGKMFDRARAAGGHQRNAAFGAYGPQLHDVEAAAHAVARHAIEHDLARAAPLRFDDPVEGIAGRIARACGVAGELLHAIALIDALAVDAHHHALRAEALAQRVDQFGVLERRRIHRYLLRARRQDLLRQGHRADSSGHAEGNVQSARHARYPGAVHRAPFRTRGDVVEHEFIRARVAIAGGKLQDVADDAVVAKTHALDHLAVAHVQTGNYAFGKNGCKSSAAMSSSSNALPLTAALAPACASARRSRASRTPPEACQWMSGWRRAASPYRSMFGPLKAPSRPTSVHSTCLSCVPEKFASALQRVESDWRCQPWVATQGQPPLSRTSKASTTRSAPKCSSHARTCPTSVSAALPITTRAAPRSSMRVTAAVSRKPPPTCSLRPLVAASSSMMARLPGLPSLAPSRSTTC